MAYALFTGRLLPDKKGTEKPIEIFVALFIILAVSMIMLKMFKGQISEKTTEMKDEQRKSDLEQRLNDARLLCKSLCSAAAEDGCTPQTQAAFCMRKLHNLDLDGNLETGNYDDQLLAGIGVCEDAIYCPMLTSCTCGKSLTLKNCQQILCDYWEAVGITTLADRTTQLQNTYVQGGCLEATDPRMSTMWNTVIFPAPGLTCG